jgi:hypothetical protein
MSETTKKNFETCLLIKSICIDGAHLSLGQFFQENRGKPWQDCAFIERFFATMTTDLLQREVSKCQTR